MKKVQIRLHIPEDLNIQIEEAQLFWKKNGKNLNKEQTIVKMLRLQADDMGLELLAKQ